MLYIPLIFQRLPLLFKIRKDNQTLNDTKKNTCGNCKYHIFDKRDECFKCFNKKSYNYGDFTKGTERCPDHKGGAKGASDE